jgi:hypothetical protein
MNILFSSILSMSIKQSIRTTTITITTMNRCKVCAKIGRDANHYTKVHGVVVCPTIKNAVCKVCGLKGHFQDHCTKGSTKDMVSTKDHCKENQEITPIVKAEATNVKAEATIVKAEATIVKAYATIVKGEAPKQQGYSPTTEDDITDEEDTTTTQIKHANQPVKFEPEVKLATPQVKLANQSVKLAPWAKPNTQMYKKSSWAYDSDEE